MPIYPYKCTICEFEMELEHGINEPPKKRCQKCGRDGLKRQIGQTMFQLAGGSWGSSGYK